MQLKKTLARQRRRSLELHAKNLARALSPSIPPKERRLLMAEAACSGVQIDRFAEDLANRLDRDAFDLATRLDRERSAPPPTPRPAKTTESRPRANGQVWVRCAITGKLIRTA
jgi:hypothetical protein